MSKSRLEAFSDGVIAILITIMVLELKVPPEPTWHGLTSEHLAPTLVSYVLSFAFLGIYWTNHHHLLHTIERVSGRILWTNLHLLFWLSLVPFAMGWMGQSHFAPIPTAVYGIVQLLAAVAWQFLQFAIIAEHGPGSKLKTAVGRDAKGKLSAVAYLVAIPLALVRQEIALGIYIFVALVWLIPDRRIEAVLKG